MRHLHLSSAFVFALAVAGCDAAPADSTPSAEQVVYKLTDFSCGNGPASTFVTFSSDRDRVDYLEYEGDRVKIEPVRGEVAELVVSMDPYWGPVYDDASELPDSRNQVTKR